MAPNGPRDNALDSIRKATEMLKLANDTSERCGAREAALVADWAHVIATRAVAFALLDVADAIRGKGAS